MLLHYTVSTTDGVSSSPSPLSLSSPFHLSFPPLHPSILPLHPLLMDLTESAAVSDTLTLTCFPQSCMQAGSVKKR